MKYNILVILNTRLISELDQHRACMELNWQNAKVAMA